MYDYGARFYMPDIGRWGVVDPLAEKYPEWTPYAYTFQNSVNYIDPTGMEGLGWIKDKKSGNVFWDNNTNSQKEFKTNYKGKESSYSYVSDKDDSRAYTLPNGDGTVYMDQWNDSYKNAEGGNVGPNIQMSFSPAFTDDEENSGWFQTFKSNVPNFDSNIGLEDFKQKAEERVDNGFGNPDPTKSEYFNHPSLTDFSDDPQRRPNSNGIVNWDAQNSMIIGGKKSFTVKYGFSITKDGKVSYRKPTINSATSVFHNIGIKNLPKINKK
ncbi:MAG: hypothetical protein K0Q82_3032 [Chryseobacterium indoltheticum]|jgi:hypothetical protein|nr:hypothetical protein [Chryseobacterium indoltheticum]